MKRAITLPTAVSMLFTLTSCTALSALSMPTPEPTYAPRAIQIERPIVPPDVPMLDQDGRPAKLSDFHGKHIMVFFGNVACHEDCLDGLAEFAQVQQRIGPRNDLAYVMVGMDITADAPDKLKARLSQTGVTGLTAERAPMRELAVKFGIHTYERKDGTLAPHAPFTYLIDPDGRLIYFFQDGLPAADIADILRSRLAE